MKRSLAAIVAALTLLVACGSDGTTTTASTATASASSAPAAPQRIVSLSASATEMLFAIGAGKQVVAVDDQSNYPSDAPKTDLSGYQPNVEAIATYNPDLVVISGDTAGLVAGLETLKVPVVVAPAAKILDDTYQQLTDLGARTGHQDEAAKVVTKLKTGVADLIAQVPKRTTALTYYYELDNTLFTVTSSTFIGQLFKLVGLENVADPADANGQSGGYPQLSAEYLVKADPDFVFLADTKCCQQDGTTFAARPGFAGLKAVAAKQIVSLDDDVASRWGPRVVDLLRAIVDAVKVAPAQ